MLSEYPEKIFSRFSFASLFCFLGGALCALAMAPYNVWGVLIIGFGTLYAAMFYAKSTRQAFVLGWLFGFGYFVFGLYWIGNALLVEGNPYKWAWPLAVCGLPALLAFFPAIACWIAKKFLNLSVWHGYLGFALLIGAFEWLRGHAFTGFPWNLYGYTWADTLPVMQFVSLESVYSLTLLTIFWAGVGGFVVVSPYKKQSISLIVTVLISFAGVYGYGAQRLANTNIPDQLDVAVRVVQPNTPQAEKWERDKMPIHFDTALELSMPEGEQTDIPTIIVWPETTLSPAYLNDPYVRGRITRMLSYYKEAELITGALRYILENDSYFNSVVTINQDGSMTNIYDKSHLVPFGEYIPFQTYIPLAPVAKFKGMAKGAGKKMFSTLANLKYSAIICYEVIFPRQVVGRNDQVDMIVNVTNDAWYGNSPGPRQHLVISRFRAVEENAVFVRAANTGISAVIDPFGRIQKALPFSTTGAIFETIPAYIK